ncbi:MAG: hypothetical protein CV089_00745 [Nitrospira sp. WS110]|nr:hypothetical protein [Nitrospira sp. WS110]
MKRLGRIFNRISIAACAVSIYAVLVVMSASCILVHADRIQSHHHGEGKSSSQNAFCAWACQATSDVVAVAQSQVAVAWLVAEPQVLPHASYVVSSVSTVSRPRAPPTTISPSQG